MGQGLSVSTKFAAVTAETRVSKLPLPTAVSTISVGNRDCAIAVVIKMVKKKLKIVLKRTPFLKLNESQLLHRMRIAKET